MGRCIGWVQVVHWPGCTYRAEGQSQLAETVKISPLLKEGGSGALAPKQQQKKTCASTCPSACGSVFLALLVAYF